MHYGSGSNPAAPPVLEPPRGEGRKGENQTTQGSCQDSGKRTEPTTEVFLVLSLPLPKLGNLKLGANLEPGARRARHEKLEGRVTEAGPFSGLTSPAVVWESMATGHAPAPGQCTVHNSSCRLLSAEISASDGTSSRPRVRHSAFRIKRAYSASSEFGSACSVLD
jgi:hypothetical protein